MNKIESYIAHTGIYSMLLSVVVFIIIPAYELTDKNTLNNIIFYLAPILLASILIGIIICIKDVFLRFKAGERTKWIFLLIIFNAMSYPYYVKNYALKPRTNKNEKI